MARTTRLGLDSVDLVTLWFVFSSGRKTSDLQPSGSVERAELLSKTAKAALAAKGQRVPGERVARGLEDCSIVGLVDRLKDAGFQMVSARSATRNDEQKVEWFTFVRGSNVWHDERYERFVASQKPAAEEDLTRLSGRTWRTGDVYNNQFLIDGAPAEGRRALSINLERPHRGSCAHALTVADGAIVITEVPKETAVETAA